MMNNFKTYMIGDAEYDEEEEYLPVGYMNYEMIRKLFHVYNYEQDYDGFEEQFDYMKHNPLYYGYVSIEIDDDINDNTNDNGFNNYNLMVNKIKYWDTIKNTKINLEPLIINRNINNKILIKKELLKICKYDAIYEILNFI